MLSVATTGQVLLISLLVGKGVPLRTAGEDHHPLPFQLHSLAAASIQMLMATLPLVDKEDHTVVEVTVVVAAHLLLAALAMDNGEMVSTSLALRT